MPFTSYRPVLLLTFSFAFGSISLAEIPSPYGCPGQTIVGSLDTGGGDGGSATLAHLAGAGGLARDRDGNLYIADSGNQKIRRVSPSGVITTFAGNGVPTSSGDGGPAVAASLNVPYGIAVDASGNVYVAESQGRRIRRIAKDGTISTVAGTGHAGSFGDGGPAVKAMLYRPTAVAVDGQGALFVRDLDDRANVQRIRRISPDGVIQTVLGGGSGAITDPDGQAGTSLSLGTFDMTVTANGDLVVALSGVVASLDAEGVLHDISGPSTAANTSPAEGQPARQTWLNASVIAALGDGSIVVFVSAQPTNQVWRIAPDGSLHLVSNQLTWGYHATGSNSSVLFSYGDTVWTLGTTGPPTLVAGTVAADASGDGGPASQAVFQEITALAADSAGNLFIADKLAGRVRRIGTDRKISTFAGGGQSTADGGPASQASLYRPSALAFDNSGNLYVAESASKVRKIATDGTISHFAGGACTMSECNPDGLAINAKLTPAAIAADSKGQVFILDSSDPTSPIWRVDLTGKISYFGRVGFSVDSRTQAAQMAMDSDGSAVVFLAPTGFLVRVSTNGQPTTVNLPPYVSPESLIFGAQGEFYLAELSGKIYKLGTDNSLHLVWDTALNVDPMYVNAVLPMAISGTGNLYIAEQIRNRIIEIPNASSCVGTQRPLVVNHAYNGASSVGDSQAPGEIVAFYGIGIGPAQPADRVIVGGTLFDTEAGGTRVLFDGVPAPILYASDRQVNTVIPYELSGAYFANVSIEVNGVASDLGSVTLAEAAPGIFTRDSSGKGQAACLNQDYSANSDSKPAAKGSVIMLYLTGEGQTAPAGTDGLIATNPKQLPTPLAKVTATIDGQAADVQYEGGALGMVAGLMQVNVKIPDAARSGSAIPVVVQVGTAKSADGVTLTIQ